MIAWEGDKTALPKPLFDAELPEKRRYLDRAKNGLIPSLSSLQSTAKVRRQSSLAIIISDLEIEDIKCNHE